MAATFPAGLYSHGASQQDATLTQAEWNQVGFEVEALEAALGTNPHASTAMGRTYASVDARLEDIEGFIAAFGQTGLRALVIVPNSGAPNTAVDVTAALLAVGGKVATSVSKTASIATYTGGVPTVNGRDFAGSPATNTWYYLHAIWNPTSDSVDTLWSASATAPTLPSGYTRARRIACGRTNASGYLLRFIQQDRRVIYTDTAIDLLFLPTWVTTYTAYSVATRVPPVSRMACLSWAIGVTNANQPTAQLLLSHSGVTAGQVVLKGATGLVATWYATLWWALSSTQQVEYKFDVAQGGTGPGPVTTLYCLGYEDPI